MPWDAGSYRKIDMVVAIIPMLTGPVSLVSSLVLLRRLVPLVFPLLTSSFSSSQLSSASTGAVRPTKPRDSLLLGLSVLDVCGSFGLSFSTLPAPSFISSTRYPAMGTIGTCTGQGFLVHLGIGVPLYNAALAIYFLCSVRYRVRDQVLRTYMVPIVHVVVWGFIVGTGAFALRQKLFNSAGVMGCWIHRVPKEDCVIVSDMCSRGIGANEYQLYFGLLHVALSFAVVLFCMIILYITVLTIEQNSRRWNPASRWFSWGSLSASHHTLGSDTTSARAILSIRRIFNREASNVTSPETSEGNSSRRRLSQGQSSSSQNELPLSQRTLETGLLYSATFLMVYFPTSMLGTVIRRDRSGQTYDIFLVFNSVFLPLQGFFKLLIYTAPEWRPKLRRRLERLSLAIVSDAQRDSTGRGDAALDHRHVSFRLSTTEPIGRPPSEVVVDVVIIPMEGMDLTETSPAGDEDAVLKETVMQGAV